MLDAFIGQRPIIDDLSPRIESAKKRNGPVEHLLFCAPEGMGKATLAQHIAYEMGVNVRQVNGDGIERVGDMAAIFTNLKAHDILLIEDIESLGRALVEMLHSTMEDFAFDIVIGKGSSARNVRLKLPKFTLIGTTHRPWKIDRRLYKQFIKVYEFSPYSMAEMALIVSVLAYRNKMESDTDACFLIASQCNGLPSEAASLWKKMTAYGDVISKGRLTLDIARDGMTKYGRPKLVEYPADLALRLSDMSGVEFEEYVGKLFEDMGYNVEHTKATGDQGIDLVMRKGNEHIAVQCKRWSSPVGEPVVRDFFGALIHSGAKLGLIVTTTVFTPQSKSFAEGKPIHLIDLDRLMEISRKSRPIKRNNDIPPSPAPLL